MTYDISRENTFQNVSKWLNEVSINSGSDVIVFLVGTQCDKEDIRAVTKEQAREFVDKHNLDYFIETSAKTNHNIEKLFTVAAQKLYVKYKVKNMLGDSKSIISGEKEDNVTLKKPKNYEEHTKAKKCA